MKNLYLIFILVLFSFLFKESSSQTQIWLEDFPYTDGTTQGSGTPPKWTRTAPAAADWFEVRSNQMEGVDLDGEAVWTSESIDITGYTDIQISVDISQTGAMNDNDYVKIYYLLNGWTKEFVIGEYTGVFGTATPTITGLFGNSLVLIIKVRNDENTHIHNFDNVLVQGTVFAGPQDPKDFIATSVSESQIDLSFSTNLSGDDVIIVWNNTGVFTTPSGAPPAVGQSFGGGTLLYQGTSSPVNHTSLTSCAYYYYASWSYDGSDYSNGVLEREYLREKITLPWSEGFESVGPTTAFYLSEPVINGTCGWAYEKTQAGRLQFTAYSNSGTQGAAMDANDFFNSINHLTATLNLSDYATTTNLELSFYHMAPGGEDASLNDRVWVRGSDSDPWIEIYNLAANQGPGDIWVQVTGLDIDDAISNAGQIITSTFQLRFGQQDNNAFDSEGRAFDDILIEGDLIIAPDPPISFEATAINSSQIDLSFTPNVATDDVIIVWNNTGTFTSPSGVPPTIGNPFAGGTVLYQGTSGLVNHTGLTNCTNYYYKAWSYDGVSYSVGLTDGLLLQGAISLPWTEDFESIGPITTFTSSQTSINGTCEWSYEKTSAGRLRFELYANNGLQAAAMDANDFLNSVNHLIATLDISDYVNSNNLELSFYHMNYNDDNHANDKVWVRGSDSDSWIVVYDLYANQGPSGVWVQATGIDIDAAISGAGQTITSTFQLRFGQEDNNAFTNEGRAFDDISIDGDVIIFPDPPVSFIATANGSSQIDLSFTPNVASDDVLIVWNNTGIFIDPTGVPPAAGDPFAGGTLLYQGTSGFVNHTGLTNCNYYYYKAWSYDGLYYSSGITDGLLLQGPITLPWTEDFEGITPITTFTDPEPYINGSCKWSYEKTQAARLRFEAYAYNGSQAAAMDANDFLNSINHLIGTLDLSTYSGATNLELSFYHMAPSGEDISDNDRVWIRGSDSDAWIQIYNLAANQGPDLTWVQATGLDIDAAILGAGQTITSTFQLRLGQQDNNAFENEGRAFDDIVITGSLGPSDPPVADFVANNTSPDLFETVQFTDLSTEDPDSWSWSFSPNTVTYVGGTSPTSQNPQVQFNTIGNYTVQLIAGNVVGTDDEIKTDYISVSCGEISIFPWVEGFNTNGQIPQCWQNIDYAGSGKIWEFDNPGDRTVNTTTSSDGFAIFDSDNYGPGTGSEDCDLISPSFDFTSGTAAIIKFEHYFRVYQNTVEFSFSIDGGSSWIFLDSWSGTTDNPEQAIYDISTIALGESNVMFKWYWTGDWDWFWAIDDIYISNETAPADPPLADFLADNTTPLIGETVSFTDLSTNSPGAWKWIILPATYTFVNGTNSSSQNLQVQFDASGYYTVKLIAANIIGSDQEIKSNYINVECNTPVSIPWTEQFDNAGSIPSCWMNIDNAGNGKYWEFDNPGDLTVNTTTSANGFAIFDSDNYGSGTGSEDCDLITPIFDLSSETTVFIHFEHYFRQGYGGAAEFFLSIDGGASWTSMDAWAASSTANAQLESYDISTIVGGESQVAFKWNWIGDWSWWWAIDDIIVTNELPPTDPPVADFSADITTPQIGETVSFTDLSTNSPGNWSWSISPSTFTFVSGTNSSSQNPQIQFDAVGYYTIELTASNILGPDSEIKLNYISVECDPIATLPWMEQFNTGGTIPSCWLNVDNAGNGKLWQFDNPGDVTVNTTTNENGFAIFDSDNYGNGSGDEDCDLISPVFDLSSETTLFFQFEHYFRSGYGGAAEFFISIDGGVSWTSFDSWSSSTSNAQLESYDLSVIAGGESQVMFRWNWTGDWSWYWAIDDILLTNQQISTGQWIGFVNNDWNNTGNWDDGIIPGLASEVTIPSGVSYFPIIDETIECKSVYINDGAELSIISGGDLTIFGNLTNGEGSSGVFHINDGICTIDGRYYSEIGATTDIDGGLWSFYDWNRSESSVWSKGNIQLSGGTINAQNDIVWSNFSVNGIIDGPVVVNIGGSFRNSDDDWTITDGTFNMLGTNGSGPFFIMASSWGSGNLAETPNLNIMGADGTVFQSNPNTDVTGLIVQGDLKVTSGHFRTEGNAGNMSDNVSISGNLTIETIGQLTANVSGNFNVLGEVNIFADQNNSGSLIDNGNINVTGSAKVQQYLASERWHLVSAPVSGSTINSYMDIYFKEYDEPNDDWNYFVLPTTIPIVETKGYAAWASDALTGPITVILDGVLNTGDYYLPSLSYTLTSTNVGWNLIGNPYPSSLQWNNSWSKTDLSEWACIHSNGNDACYNASTGAEWPNVGDLPNGDLGPTQGFWVRATSDVANLTIPNSERLHNNQALYKDGLTQIQQTIRLRVDGNNDFDAVLIQFNNEASSGFDSRFDLEKRWGYDESPQIYSMITEEELFSVDVRQEVVDELVIPLGFQAGTSGQFVLEATQFEGFDGEYTVVLEDIKESVFTKIQENTIYEFRSHTDEIEHRFNLHFKDQLFDTDENDLGQIQIYSYDKNVYIVTPEGGVENIVIFDMMGHEILKHDGSKDEVIKIHVKTNSGFYIVKAVTNGMLMTKKVYIN